MIEVNKIQSLNPNTYYILTDFDGTLTTSESDTSWAAIFKTKSVTKEFVDECIRIYKYYRKFEIDESLDYDTKYRLMKEWYEKNIQTLIDFKISESVIDEATSSRQMTFRKGAKEFLQRMYERNIPVIIISAGVGNFIREFLIRNDSMYPNIHICSNFLTFKNGIVSGVENNSLINSMNKNEASLPQRILEEIENRGTPVILGDQISDLSMLRDESTSVRIAFITKELESKLDEFKKYFDIICNDDESFDKLKIYGL